MANTKEQCGDTHPGWQPLLLFLGLSATLTWGLWLSARLVFSGSTNLFIFAGAWMPSLSALVVTGYVWGSSKVRSLLGSLVRWRARWYWYLVAISGFAVPALFAATVHDLFFGSDFLAPAALAERLGASETSSSSILLQFPAVYLMHLFGGGPIAEELGWRGFAQPYLQSRIGAGPAGLAVGILWSFWHLPLFFFFPEMTGHIPLAYHVVMMAAASILFAWVYNATGQSVLFSILFHASLNVSTSLPGLISIGQSQSLLIIFLILLGLMAVWAFFKMSRQGEIST